MKTLFKLLFIGIPVFCNAQESKDKFRIGVSYSPQMILPKQEVKNLHSNYCFSTGINGSLKVGDRFRIELGAQYAVRKFTRDNITYIENLNPQTGTYDTTYSISYTLSYIEIPLTLKYTWKQTPKWGFTVGVGGIQQLPIDQRTSWNMSLNDGTEKRGFKYMKNQQKTDLFVTGAMVLIGVDYQMTSRLHCVFQPFAVNYFTRKSVYYANQTGWLAGVNLSFQYSF